MTEPIKLDFIKHMLTPIFTSQKRQLPRFFFFSDQHTAPNWQAICSALPVGCGVVCRDYQAPNRAQLARDMAAFCQNRGLRFLVAGDPALALKFKAGLHCPEKQTTNLKRHFHKLRCQNPNALITSAAHNLSALHNAKQTGVNAVFLSPVFTTKSHIQAQPLGVIKTAQLIRQSKLPVFALGGMTLKNHQRLQKTGHAGFAAISYWQKIFG